MATTESALGSRMPTLRKPLELPPQFAWKHGAKPELSGWMIKARNYDAEIANRAFSGLSLVNVAFTYCLYTTVIEDENLISKLSISAAYFTALLISAYTITHQKINVAYRFTESGIEYCEWQDFPTWLGPGLRSLAGILAFVFICLAVIDPIFLLGALAAPGAMVLTYLGKENSERCTAVLTEYHHLTFRWEDFISVTIAKNRELIRLNLRDNNDIHAHTPKKTNLLIFCKHKKKEKIANLIRPFLAPDLPFVREKVEIL